MESRFTESQSCEISKSHYKGNECSRTKTPSLSAKRYEAYCGERERFSFTKTINWCRGTNRVTRGITHTRSCTLEHRNPNRAYISPRPSICRCVTEHRLIVLEIYIYLGLNYPCQTTRSRTTLPLLAFLLFYRSLRSLRITSVNVRVRRTNPDLSSFFHPKIC